MEMPDFGDMNENDIAKFLASSLDDLFGKLISTEKEAREEYLKSPFKSKKKHLHIMEMFDKQVRETNVFREQLVSAIKQQKPMPDKELELLTLEKLSSRSTLIQKILSAKKEKDRQKEKDQQKKMRKELKQLKKLKKELKQLKKGKE